MWTEKWGQPLKPLAPPDTDFGCFVELYPASPHFYSWKHTSWHDQNKLSPKSFSLLLLVCLDTSQDSLSGERKSRNTQKRVKKLKASQEKTSSGWPFCLQWGAVCRRNTTMDLQGLGSCRSDKEPRSRTCSGRTALLSLFLTTEVGLRQSKLSDVTCLVYHLPPPTHPWPNLGTLNHHIFHSFGQTTDNEKVAVCQKTSRWERRLGGLNRAVAGTQE